MELLLQRMVRDPYSEGGQLHMTAAAAIEVACWDIVGKSVGLPVHAILGGRMRDRVRAYANGWYRVDRTLRRSRTPRARLSPAATAPSSSTCSAPRGGSRSGARRTCPSTSWPPSGRPWAPPPS
ncbi:MAG: hypothetical protein R3C32_03675 [Chloroflexota bacterium]